MQIGFKYHKCSGFGRLYSYAIKHNYMITKEAKQRLKILLFWKEYGLKATFDAFKVKRSTLYNWWNIYENSEHNIDSLNPRSQARINRNKRDIHPLILKEIRRLRLEMCPNMGKAKIKKNLDIFCKDNHLKVYSESKIGRIIVDKKIYYHRQKISHFGKLKTLKKNKKIRKPDTFQANSPGDLVEIDTIVRFMFNIKRYIITAVDVKTRYSFSYAYKKHDSSSTKDFFKKLEIVFPYKIKAIQTDNGSEFHKYFMKYLKEINVVHYWNYKGRPYRNGHIEKYNRTIQEEFIDQNEILLEDVNEFNKKLMDWLLWYNTKRYHWSLKLQSPVDYLIENNYLSNMCWTNTYY